MEQKTTSPVSARYCLRNKRGFTLLELLVVMLIIALLAGLLIPVVMRSQRQAKRLRTASDLQAIGVALAAYKADFGDYPRVDTAGTGFAVLCQALISPGPAVGPLVQTPLGAAPFPVGTFASTGTVGSAAYSEYVAVGKPDATGGFSASSSIGTAPDWVNFPVHDGVDGPGFKVRFGGQPKVAYLQPEKFNVHGLAMFDVWGHPILYFPGRPQKPVADATGKWPLLVGGAGSLYNIVDNITFFLRFGETIANANNALKRMDGFIVDHSTNFDGIVDAGETAITTGDYLLWSAGQDGQFGVTSANIAANPTSTEIESCDDVTNFK